MEDKKKYIKPEAEVINFSDDDIITSSNPNLGNIDDTIID